MSTCEHGSLERQCFVCELQAEIAAKDARIKELEKERDEAGGAVVQGERGT